jgi:heme exporter protein C
MYANRVKHDIERIPRGLSIAAGALGLLLPAALYAIFVHAPVERTMGVAQRIFYFHVPCAMSMEYLFFACGLCSAVYLARRDDRWDALAVALAEVGMMFFACVLTTGPLWARKAWGVWWTWDPRLTSTLVAGMIYFSYLVLRGAGGIGESGKRFAAGLAIVGALDIPIIKFSVERWRGTHPQVITGKGGGIHPDMKPALLLSMLTIVLLAIVLVWVRTRAERSIQRLDRLEMEAVDRGLLEEF